jgi:Kelch motif
MLHPSIPSRASRGLSLLALVLLVASPPLLAGTWTRLVHNAPAGCNLMLLLGDGSVMVAQNDGSTIGKGWFRLTPDANGSYVNGTWTTLASAHDTRLYYPAEVLMDGRVFVAGGEYGTGGPRAEVYDPQTNVWTSTLPPGGIWTPGPDNFYDCNSEIMPDGRVLIMPVFPHIDGVPLLYDPAHDIWRNTGALAFGTFQDEASWVKLPDDSILTIDPFGTHSERYIPSLKSWVNDSTVPNQLYDPFGSELGGALLLPNGKAFFLGATGQTAQYTPTLTTSPGVWTAAAPIPSGKGTPDAPCAMLVTGNILCAVSPAPTSGNHFPSPTTFYEYDYTTNSYTPEPAPNGASDPISSYMSDMLDLPDGTVLYSHFGADLYVYAPTGTPLAAGKPAITSITPNGDGSYHLVGTGLNGISEGASYGDDLQMNSNYPIVRLRQGAGVWYARSHNWSSTSVMTGALPVSTEFHLPAGLPLGSYSLEVVANGIASDPVNFTTPGLGVWASLGGGLTGGSGVPALTGSGSQLAGEAAEIDLASASPSSAALLLVGVTNGSVPFKGGTLVPVPFMGTVPAVTDGSGGIALPFTWPTGVPAATDLYYQYVVADAGAPQGFAISTALRSTSP